jgi:hypothetical protein
VRSFHTASAVSCAFDEPNLVSCAGLVPVMRLAERCGLHELARQRLSVPDTPGANSDVKVASIVAGMVAGADSIDDLDLLRHGGMRSLYDGIRAPSTLGTFLRAFGHGQARQVEMVAREMLVRLARHTPLLAGIHQLCFVDVDSSLHPVFGAKKQGAAFGHAKVGGYSALLRGYNPLVATISTPDGAPLVVGTRMRAGNASSAKKAASFVTETIGVARRAGATGHIVFRADSAFYSGRVVAAARRAGAHVSVTVRMDSKIRAAIEMIDEQQWMSIRYPNAIWDDEEQRWISDAQIAEIPYTAFEGSTHEMHGRLIVRRVKRLNAARTGQGELFDAWRYHAAFTTTSFVLEQAEPMHRAHAVVEQVVAELKNGPAAHLPSGQFAANAAWFSLAALVHNLTRAAGALAGMFHAKARTATIRAQLIGVPARIARRARRVHLHLPIHWPWQHDWAQLFHATHRAPPVAA